MAYPKVKESYECSDCGAELKDSFLTVRDIFLVFEFFKESDGADNIFCNSNCLANYLLAEVVEWDKNEEIWKKKS